jgi:hypothetical protein
MIYPSDDSLNQGKNQNPHESIKLFSQKLAWRNGRDTAYNVKALGRRLTQKLRVLKLFQEMPAQTNNFHSHRTTQFLPNIKPEGIMLMTSRLSTNDISAGNQNLGYQKKLKSLFTQHQTCLRTLVNRKESKLLIESSLNRNRRASTIGFLF